MVYGKGRGAEYPEGVDGGEDEDGHEHVQHEGMHEPFGVAAAALTEGGEHAAAQMHAHGEVACTWEGCVHMGRLHAYGEVACTWGGGAAG